MNILLDNSGSNVKKIYHIADIHIRQLKRHEEYRSVFSNLYKELQKQGTDDSILVIVGDILHSKNELSPESIEMTVDFFTNISNLLPLIIIAGNHDANLSNRTRLDSLSPICEKITNTKYSYYYLKNSGVFKYNNLIIVANSLLDDKFIKYSDLSSYTDVELAKYTTVCLWHGTVDQTVLNTGTILENEYVKKESFQGFDLTMLGDIHKHQYLNEEKTIAYSGSLIQQNFGETLGEHGMIKWNVKKKQGKFIEIKNDYGYCTMRCTSSNSVEHVDNYKIPKYPRIRLKISNSIDKVSQGLVIETLKKRYTPLDIVLDRFDDDNVECHQQVDTHLIDITSLEHQQKLLQQIMISSGDSKELIEDLLDLNKVIYQENNYLEFNDDWTWTPVLLEFSNMFCYGENNVINFTKINGIVGILAPNHYGKSSILDIILFALYDKISRGKRTDVLNKDKDTFKCCFTIQIGDELYKIERVGNINKSGQVKVNTKFFRIVNEKGNMIVKSLTGEQRKDTQKMIESYIGTYETCISTIISLQNRDMGMIDMKQTDRKQFLSSTLKLDILEQQYNGANQKYKEIDVEYKYLTKNYQNNSKTLKNEIDDIVSELKCQDKELQINTLAKKTAQEKYEILLQELVSIEKPHFENLTKEELYAHHQEVLIEISDLEFDIDNKKKLNDYLCGKLNELQINGMISIKVDIENRMNALTGQIEDLMLNVKHISEKYQDPINKENVKEDIVKSESNIQKYKDRLIQYQNRLDKLKNKEVLTHKKYKTELTLLSTKQEDINKELRELYQQLNEIDEDSLSKMDEILEKKNKIQASSNSCIDKLYLMLDSADVNENVLLIKKELESYKNNMEKLMKYKIRESNLSELFKKKKTNDKINEVIREKSNLLQSYKTEDIELNEKYNESMNLMDSINEINMSINKTNSKLDKSEMEHERNKQFISQWEENQMIHLDNIKTQSQIKDLKQTRKDEMNKLKEIQEKVDHYNELLTEKDNTEKSILEIEGKLLKLKSKISLLESDLSNIDYYQDNKLRDNEKQHYKDMLEKANSKENDLSNIINQLKVSKSIKENELQKINERNNDILMLEKKKKVYKRYLEIMGTKGGLQVDLISKSLPILENKINQVLYSVADFKVEINMTDNNVDINLIYSGNKPWTIELACGFEKFITSIAFRIAIMTISRKNKPTFFAIDEGWSNLDAENLGNIDRLLYFLKSHFTNVFVISHLDTIKSDLDKNITIEKKDGYSYICN
jgi:DNA repair exonuclease SbcCD ATPase subunit